MIIQVVLLVVTAAATSYPDCSDPATYTNYNTSTEYKGLSDDTPWDRTRQTSFMCHFASTTPLSQPASCGDCDLKLDGKTWYRFSEGPYVKIAEFLDATSSPCPKKGNCNGFYQMALIPNDTSVQRDGDIRHYKLTFSNPAGGCAVVDQAESMIKSLSCGEFILYKFPDDWNQSAPSCNAPQMDGTHLPTPYSLCMYDTVVDLTLTGTRTFYTRNDTVPLTCTSNRSPTPPHMTWSDQRDQDITSQRKRDSTLSSLFSVVYSVDSTISYTSVTCRVEDKYHTFYQVSLEAPDVTGSEHQQLLATCRVHIEHVEIQDNMYLIEVLEDGEVYYTSHNISERGDKMVIELEGTGIYRISLNLSDTTVPASSRSKTESWKCGVRDPITGIYTTVPFTVTLNRMCGRGTGFIAEATECTTCPQNTFSRNNECRECPEGEISSAGSSQCKKMEEGYSTTLSYVFIGIGVVIIVTLLWALVLWGVKHKTDSRFQLSMDTLGLRVGVGVTG